MSVPILPAMWMAWRHPDDVRLAIGLGVMAVAYGVFAWRNRSVALA